MSSKVSTCGTVWRNSGDSGRMLRRAFKPLVSVNAVYLKREDIKGSSSVHDLDRAARLLEDIMGKAWRLNWHPLRK